MEPMTFTPCDVILLEHAIPGIPYPTGVFVLWAVSELYAVVSLVAGSGDNLHGIDNPYTILREDLAAFTSLGERAEIPKASGL